MSDESKINKKSVAYAEVLVQQARSGRSWSLKRFEGGKFINFEAPASIIERLERDLPINDHEAGCFEWMRQNPDIVDRVIELTRQLIEVGHSHYEMRHIIGGMRLMKDLRVVQTSRFKINDHIVAYLSRLLNEIFGCGFFKVRHTQNEPGSDHYGSVLVAVN